MAGPCSGLENRSSKANRTSSGSTLAVTIFSEKDDAHGGVETTRISSKGQITIPQGIRSAFRIRGGQTFTFRVRKDGILLKPVDIRIADKTQSRQWADGLKAALADVKAGRVRRFKSDKAFLDHLAKLDAKAK